MSLINKNIFINKNKEKRKFILAGILNVLLTNIFLQIFLATNLFTISLSAFLSQLINMILGYVIYSKFIFKVKNLRNHKFIKKYAILMISLWLINTIAIKTISLFGFSKNLSAFMIIPLLAVISYLVQKVWIFRKR